MSKPLLIIGKPHSSKSVFIAQLYTRLQKKKSRLKLYASVKNLTSIKDVRDALAQGDEPAPTKPDRNVDMLLPISFGDEQIDLVCPDYGGEQINRIMSTRKVEKLWIDAIEGSMNWLFFIRLTNINIDMDISKVTVTDEHPERSRSDDDNYEYLVSDQTAFIELLQILLAFKNHDYHLKNANIRLTVVLTCWDELKTKTLPKDKLEEYLPLLYGFIHANWDPDYIKIVGLSAQGFSLADKKNKEKYLINGPENYGYLIKPDGSRTKDITELIVEAL